ncbi:MAG: lamin tail domain-containing protein [Planctomycetota bacterium]
MPIHRTVAATAAATAMALAAPPSHAQRADGETQHGPIVISEIMYNPASREGGYVDRDTGQPVPTRTEWVELYNPTDEPVGVSHWLLADEDGMTGPLPAETVIEPSGVLVVSPMEVTAEEFRAAWGEGVDVVGVARWSLDGMANLANSPSPTNERLQLRDGRGKLIDEVNYDDEAGWPADSPQGPSIYVRPGHLTPGDNDDAIYWARSEVDVDGGRVINQTDVFNRADIGSPGTVVATETEAP